RQTPRRLEAPFARSDEEGEGGERENKWPGEEEAAERQERRRQNQQREPAQERARVEVRRARLPEQERVDGRERGDRQQDEAERVGPYVVGRPPGEQRVARVQTARRAPRGGRQQRGQGRRQYEGNDARGDAAEREPPPLQPRERGGDEEQADDRRERHDPGFGVMYEDGAECVEVDGVARLQVVKVEAAEASRERERVRAVVLKAAL